MTKNITVCQCDNCTNNLENKPKLSIPDIHITKFHPYGKIEKGFFTTQLDFCDEICFREYFETIFSDDNNWDYD